MKKPGMFCEQSSRVYYLSFCLCVFYEAIKIYNGRNHTDFENYKQC